MANRARTHDEQVYSLKDLERLGSEKLVKATRGKFWRRDYMSIAFPGTNHVLRVL